MSIILLEQQWAAKQHARHYQTYSKLRDSSLVASQNQVQEGSQTRNGAALLYC
jgi:hypothetical protein